jgi:4-hydroxythreonine-4-phosphate dehydrogenase
MRPVLGLTLGDPAGIGPEICLRALREPAVLRQCVPVLFGDVAVIHQLLSSSSSFSRSLTRLPEVVSLAAWKKLPRVQRPLIIDCAALNAAQVKPGKISAACGRAGYAYIEHAIQAALAHKIDAVVTAPIHKEALRLAGVRHPGHTEIFTALTKAPRSCMMLYSAALTVSMVTTHIGYHEVPARLSAARILDVIELTAQALRWLRGCKPRLGVCGLNPVSTDSLAGARRRNWSCPPSPGPGRAA